MKKKILILYATYGNGHKSIANYLSKTLSENENYEVKIIDILDFSTKIIGSVSKKTFEKIWFYVPFIWDITYTMFNFRYNPIPSEKILTGLFKNKKLKKEILDFYPDLVLATHFSGASLIGEYKSKKIINTKLITILTDYDLHEVWIKSFKNSDYAIVNSIEEVKILKKRIDRKKIKNFGIPISSEFNENLYNLSDIRKKYKIDKFKKTVCFFGDNAGSLSAYQYIKKLIKKDLHINLIFISGRNRKIEAKVKQLKGEFKLKNTNLIILGFVWVPPFLSVSDLVVTKPGGATVTECVYFRKPMVFINQNFGQEKANYKYFVKNGCAKKLKNPFSFVRFIEYIVDNNYLLERMSERTKNLSKNQAMDKLYNLCEKILK